MKADYRRTYPLFALCGLNCGLCPRHNTKGASACPGCGGEDFGVKHPSCRVINCALRHGEVEYCFECVEYPCVRYVEMPERDSFITYAHVKSDLDRAAKIGLEAYAGELERRVALLESLLDAYDDGRSKSFYCTAANLLPVEDLERIIGVVEADVDPKARAKLMREKLESAAAVCGISLKLRNM